MSNVLVVSKGLQKLNPRAKRKPGPRPSLAKSNQTNQKMRVEEQSVAAKDGDREGSENEDAEATAGKERGEEGEDDGDEKTLGPAEKGSKAKRQEPQHDAAASMEEDEEEECDEDGECHDDDEDDSANDE